MKNVGIVIPTYNAHNSIIDTIKLVKHFARDAKIVVVDDNSPDDTAYTVTSIFKKDKNIIVIKRSGKQGRGSAVIAGFKKLLQYKEIEYFIEMDADLCHNPKYIPILVNACKKADIVITSRYLKGSTISGWNMKRKFLSKLINTAAKLFLQVPITDYSNGYRCYNKIAVEFICRNRLKSTGFIVLSEVVYICYKKGMHFTEIPFDFNYLAVSKSNLNVKEMREAIVTLAKLRFTK